MWQLTAAQARRACRLYKARGPACTHAYALRNATVAQHFVDAIGHDVNRPVDLAMIALLKAHHLPGYVMLPPPVSQLWRTDKRKVRPPPFHRSLL